MGWSWLGIVLFLTILYSEQFEFGAYWSLYGVKNKDLIAYLDFFPRKTTCSKNREFSRKCFLKNLSFHFIFLTKLLMQMEF